MTNSIFMVEIEKEAIKSIKHPEDRYSMNWVEGVKPWGSIIAPEGVAITVSRELTQEGTLKEKYAFTNEGGYPKLTSLDDIGIYTPFNDSYHEAETCMKSRCHAHIWCGGTSSYVMCLRMGGEGPHLGLVLTAGSLGAYSTERVTGQSSDDRGDFILHPSPMDFDPGETKVLEWELFWHGGKDDFYRQLRKYPSYIEIKANHFVAFRGEDSRPEVVPREGQEPVTVAEDRHKSMIPGERVFIIKGNNANAWCRTLELPPLMELAAARCAFISERQQYRKPGSALDGAYLIYDNEEGHMVYYHNDENNAGRERIGMGALMARYLRLHPQPHGHLAESLKNYLAYVLRELFDSKTGMVYDDVMRNNPARIRLYNFSWAALFFLELHGLWNDDAYLRYAYITLQKLYELGGTGFYTTNLPIVQILSCLEKSGMKKEYDALKKYFILHADTILANGLHYPAHEIKYGQSIAAPAADILLQAYIAFGDEKYFEGGKKHIEILSLFSGRQPDSCLYETAIRHWDGFWSGKRRLYGDTFPHCWSALSGMANAWYQRACEHSSHELRSHDVNAAATAAIAVAEDSIRSVLGLIFPDGSASCARVYPLTTDGSSGSTLRRYADYNKREKGERASLIDPWANDQDWGLYFALRFFIDANGAGFCS